MDSIIESLRLQRFWDDIPIGQEKAVDYEQLCKLWNRNQRSVRGILEELSRIDNGDDYVLIRSARNKGFYKTDNPETLKLYRKECLNKGKSIFAPVRKINRVLNPSVGQYSLNNNLRLYREMAGLLQKDVCEQLKAYECGIDCALLSKMENSVCYPNDYQVSVMAHIYCCDPSELILRSNY